MPDAPLRPCAYGHGCAALVRKGNCDKHGGQRQPWQASPTTTPRLRGRANQRRRERLFAREPLCRECVKEGKVTIAVIRDHVIPLSEGGLEGVDSNEQPLCKSHSDAKTKAEAARGVRRC